MRVFLYARCSTTEQHTGNQVTEAKSAGFDIPAHRVVQETISGSTCAMQRPLFAKLLDRLEPGDTLVVCRLDRLGRSAADVMNTVSSLAERGIRIVCLQLGATDLTSVSGKLILTVLGACAEFELGLLRERTQAGLQRARAEGKQLGRPRALSAAQESEVHRRLAAGEAVAAIARALGTSRATVMRARDAAAAQAA